MALNTTHTLKIQQELFKLIKLGIKRYEIRNNDRDFQVDDTLILISFSEYRVPANRVVCRITHVLKDVPQFGLKDGYAILSFEVILFNRL